MRALALFLLLSPAALYSGMSPEVVLAAGGGPAVAASRSRLLVVFQTSDQLRAVFADFNGEPIGEPLTIAPIVSSTFRAVASDGSGFLVGWVTLGQVHAAIVRENGVVTPLSLIPDVPSMNWPERLVVAFNGARYFLFWNDTSAHAAVISPAGVIERVLHFPDLKSVSGAAGDPSRLIVLGTVPAAVGAFVGTYATTVDASLNVSAAVLIVGDKLTPSPGGTPFTFWPAIAQGPNGDLAIWLRGHTSRLEQIESTGLTSDPGAIDIHDVHDNAQNWADRHKEPRLAAAGSHFVIVWTLDSYGPYSGVWASFVDADGVPYLTFALLTGRAWTGFYAVSPDVVGFPDGHAVVVYARSPGQIVARSITDGTMPRRRTVRR